MIVTGYKLIQEDGPVAVLQNYESGEYFVVEGPKNDRELIFQTHNLAQALSYLHSDEEDSEEL
jgi:hypothetical protein